MITSLRNGDEILIDKDDISQHIVNYYENLFSANFVLHEQLLVEEVIPSSIGDEVNQLRTMMATQNEIKNFPK